MRVLIVGPEKIPKLPAGTVGSAVAASGFVPSVVISRFTKGIDRLGEAWAEAKGIPIERHTRDPRINPVASYSVQNKRVLKQADALIVIWDGKSKNLKNMAEIARAKGLPVYLHYFGEKHG